MSSKSKKENASPKSAVKPGSPQEPSFDEIGKVSESADSTETSEPKSNSSYRVFITAMLSFILLWVSFPPVGIWWLAWFAPAPLIWIVMSESLPGRRPYRQLYFAGMIYWLATFYFIPIPHPALWLAWIVLCVYLAVYIPLLIGISRTLIHRMKFPAIIFIPVVWTGLEWIRGHFATGHSFACLSHTQYQQPLLLQIADISGAYTITFAIVWVAVGVAMLGWKLGKFLLGSDFGTPLNKLVVATNLLLAVLLLGGVCFYGNMRLDEPLQYKSESVAKIALIQTSNDVIFRAPTEEEETRFVDGKRRLTQQAREQWNDLDLVVWPESAFSPFVDLVSDQDEQVTADAVANVRTQFWSDVTGYPRTFANPISLLTGGQTQDPAKDEVYNSAFMISTDGQITERYFKSHLVMLGEYVPLGEQIPFLEQLSPSGSINAGKDFKIMEINGVKLAPNICFESTVPQYMLRQVNTLTEQGSEPDVLVNITNDGWFFGTSCLDLHLACNVMRAVELRKPHLVASNTGFSANIDSCGRIIESGPRREEAVIGADIRPIVRTSFYRQIGELIPMIFGIICIGAGVIGFVAQFFTGKPEPLVQE